MVTIPYIKIPCVRVGGIDPTSDTSLAYGGGEAEEPTPITYLTQWRIVGNSEVHGQEIWSCGEYSAVDGKWHILVQPLGGSIADIALTEPLRKVNDIADAIEFSNGSAVVTRYLASDDLGDLNFIQALTDTTDVRRYRVAIQDMSTNKGNVLTAIYDISSNTYGCVEGINSNAGVVYIYDANYNQVGDRTAFINHVRGNELIYELATPTTELVDAPQIEEAESYSCVISPGGKAVSWSEFLETLNYLLTDNENNLLVDSKNYKLTVQS